MRIYLVRHGEAKSDEQDPQRRLTDRGIEDARKVAGLLRPLNLTVKTIWHSGKPRAAQTAEIIAGAVSTEDGVNERPGLAPNDPVQPIVELAGKVAGDLMIVGHLPFLDKLASALVTGGKAAGILTIPSAGVVCFSAAMTKVRGLRG